MEPGQKGATTLMNERKYRQRGYMDDSEKPSGPGPSKPRPPREPGRPAGDKTSREPRHVQMPAFVQTVSCTRCGQEVRTAVTPEAVCPKCGTDLHSCIQCTFFDPGARFECMQPVAARIAPKDARNTCTVFEPRVKVERETRTSGPAGPSSARSAFDDLFKKL